MGDKQQKLIQTSDHSLEGDGSGIYKIASLRGTKKSHELNTDAIFLFVVCIISQKAEYGFHGF